MSKTNAENEAESIDNSTDPSGAENAGGVGKDVVLGIDSTGESTEDRDVDGEDEDDEEDELTRFLTYEEPEDVDDDFDVDRDAVRQFVDEFCVVDLEAGDDLIIHKSDVFDAFMQWSKINSTDLDKLGQDVYHVHAKGDFNNMLEKEYGVEDKKRKIGGERKLAFLGFSLSELGQELVSIS